MDGMRQLLGRTDVDFTDFKAFTAEYLNRYICQFKNAYFEECSGFYYVLLFKCSFVTWIVLQFIRLDYFILSKEV